MRHVEEPVMPWSSAFDQCWQSSPIVGHSNSVSEMDNALFTSLTSEIAHDKHFSNPFCIITIGSSSFLFQPTSNPHPSASFCSNHFLPTLDLVDGSRSYLSKYS